MAVNEFEKQVQQEMETLQLAPSPEVWEQVELRIRKEKKRRWIFWIPLLLLGAGIATGTWVFNKNGRTKITIREENKNNFSKRDIRPVIKPDSTLTNFTQKDISKITLPFISTKIKSFEKGRKKIKIQQPVIAEKSNTVTNSVVLQPVLSSKLPDRKLNPVFNDISGTVSASKNAEPLVTKKSGPEPIQNIVKDLLPKDPVAAKEIIDKKADTLQTQQTVNTNTIPETVMDPKPAKEKHQRKWEWGMLLQKGSSAIKNGFAFFGGNAYAASYSNLNLSSGPSVNSAASIRPSGSVAASVLIRRNLWKRVKFELGLGYQYLSTKMDIGRRVDSTRIINNNYSTGLSVSDFYLSTAAGGSNSYTNKYHFISLSADLLWSVSKTGKNPVYWENGLRYNLLFASNALFFDANIPGYYRDFQLLTKNHLFFFTGFTFQPVKGLLIGPFAQFSLTPVLRNSNSTRTRFTDFGIRLKFSLSGKTDATVTGR